MTGLYPDFLTNERFIHADKVKIDVQKDKKMKPTVPYLELLNAASSIFLFFCFVIYVVY